MKRERIRATHVVNLLTDPHPTFVSLVEHGANQTPFKVVKTHILDMKPETHKFVFKKANFPDEASVTAYLSQKGFSDPTIESKEDSFECVFRSADSLDDITEVPCEDGVTQFVGKTKEEGAPETGKAEDQSPSTEGDQTQKGGTPSTSSTPGTPEPSAQTPAMQPVANPVLKSADGQEFVKKFDSWASYYEGDKTLAEAIQTGTVQDRNLPIGFYEVRNAFDQVIINNLKDGNLEGVDNACAEYAQVIRKLHGLFASVQKSNPEAAEKVSKSLFATSRNPSEPSPAEPVKKTEGTPEGEPPASTEPPATQTPAQGEPESEVTKAVKAALGDIRGMVSEMLKPVTEQLSAVQKQVGEMTVPTRKSADETEIEPPAGGKSPERPAETPKKASKSWDNGTGV